MRNIKDYEEKYKVEPCERYQVKYRKKLIVNLLKKYNARNILEIGCGMEPIFLDYMEYDNMCIVDPGESFIENARRLSANMPHMPILINKMFEDSLDDIGQNNIKFDFIILSSLLHELEEPVLVLQEVKKLMLPNTLLHVNVPNSNSLHRLLAKEMGLIKDEHELSELQLKMQRNRVYDITLLKEQLEKNGFEIIDEGSYFPKIFTAEQMEQIINMKILDDSIFDGLDKLIKYIPEFGSEIYVMARKSD